MIPKWFNCGECFYFKSHTRDSEDGRCFYNILSEEVVTIHFCSNWTCKRCWEKGISISNHQLCESKSFAGELLSATPWDGIERRRGKDRRIKPDRRKS